MTAPVLVRIHPGQGPFCESSYNVSFFVPFSFQNNPPQPTGAGVYTETLPEMTVAVKVFPGFAPEDDVVANAAALTNALIAAGIDFQTPGIP